jgi:PHP family Zn ribbon phosphoesterase
MSRRKTEGKRSVENLYHFSCVKCKKWWSVGDAPKSKKNWFCPWCGEKNSFSK